MVLLPIFCLIGAVAMAWVVIGDFRKSVLTGAAVWGLVLVTITEGLSLFRAVHYAGLSAAWGVVALGQLAAIPWCVSRHRNAANSARQRHVRPGRASGRGQAPFDWLDWMCCVWIGLIVGALAIVALVAAPNNWDSMVYHMARVAHWKQDQSVEFYPTHCLRQLWVSPGAEYAVLHLQVLSGGDRFASLVQWAAMAGCILGASVLAGDIGAGPRGQVLAACFTAGLPMGILQSTSTQTDYVAAFFLLCVAVFVLRILAGGGGGRGMEVVDDAGKATAKARSPHGAAAWVDTCLLGAALGLAVLTKATNWLFALPLVLWLIIAAGRRAPALILGKLALVGAITLAINLPMLSRNLTLFGHPLGPDTALYRNATLGLRPTLSNLARNAALHLVCPSKDAADRVTHAVAGALACVGINASDPDTTFGGEKFQIADMPLHEDVSGNPLHLLLVLVTMPALLLLRRLRALCEARGLMLAVAAGALLFCFYLRWQPWGSRLQLPLFIVASAPVALAVERLTIRPVAGALALLLLLAAVPWVLCNESRPLIGLGGPNIFAVPRKSQYFTGASNPDMIYELEGFVRRIRSTRLNHIGLDINANDGEYLFWALLQADGGPPVRMEHVGVTNVSSRLYKLPPFQDFPPSPSIVFTQAPKAARPAP